MARAKAFLATPEGGRSERLINDTYQDGDVLTSICSQLWDLLSRSPSEVAEECPRIYTWLSGQTAEAFWIAVEHAEPLSVGANKD